MIGALLMTLVLKARSGRYYGYDGPCPPWNDTLLHYYDFRLFALDVLRLETSGLLTGPVVKSALAGHVLGQAALLGTYSLNPNIEEDLWRHARRMREVNCQKHR